MLQVADTNGDGILQWSELIISNDIVVMATPEIANLGAFVIGLVLLAQWRLPFQRPVD